MSERETLPVGLIAYGVVALLIVVAAWQFIFDQTGTIGTAPPKVQQGRLAVLPFVNKTEEEAFDDLGYVAADWIATTLHETRNDQVVLPNEVRKHVEKADLNGKSKEFADATESNYYLLGSYKREEDSLIMNMRLIGATSGMGIDRFPEIRSAVKNPIKLVQEAGKMMQVYFEVDSSRIGMAEPPEYDTYISRIQKKMNLIQSEQE